MDWNNLELAELFGEGDGLFEVEDILNGAALPPIPRAAPPTAAAAPAFRTQDILDLFDSAAQPPVTWVVPPPIAAELAFGAEDTLESALPPMRNPWAVPQPAAAGPAIAARRKKGVPEALALALNILVCLLCAAVMAASLVMALGKDDKSIFGYHLYHVDSGSMTPSEGSSPGGFRENDAIIVKNAAPETVKQGDIVSFWKDDGHRGLPTTHRVTQVWDNGGGDISFVTKGDHNAQEDPEPVPGSRLVGVKVLTIPLLGGPMRWMDAHPWITLGVSAGVMVLVLVMYIVSVIRTGKREKE